MKFENNNGEVIKRLTKRSLKKNKVRNVFTILAIILTTFMISSVFTIGLSFLKNHNTMELRNKGNISDVTLENPTKEQVKKLKELDLFKIIGEEITVGKVLLNNLENNKAQILLKHSDKENFTKQIVPCISHIEGTYPIGENEIMISRRALEFLNKENSKLLDKIKVPINIDGKKKERDFIISGIYTTYGVVQDTGYILVSDKFIKSHNITLEKRGKLLMTLNREKRKFAKDIIREVNLKEGQNFIIGYDNEKERVENIIIVALLMGIVIGFIILSGYLLIYNILYIAVTKEINFYGLLKTIGTSPKQIKKIVKGQAIRLSVVGIPIGIALSLLVSHVVIPMLIKGMNGGKATAMPSEISFNPIIFIGAIMFSLITVVLSCRKPAKMAGNISPIEALKYTGKDIKKKSRKSTNGKIIYKMAWHNIFREKKRAIIVFLSLFMGIITFLSISTFFRSISIENYIDKYEVNDFLIQNIDIKEGVVQGNIVNKIDRSLIEKIKGIEGVKEVQLATTSILNLEMNNENLLPMFEERYRRRGEMETLKYQLEDIKNNPDQLDAPIVGLSEEFVEGLDSETKKEIDIERFNLGEIAYAVSWYYGENYRDIGGKLKIENKEKKDKRSFDFKVLTNKTNLLPEGYGSKIGLPTIYVSEKALKNLNSEAKNYFLYINVEKEYEPMVEKELKNITNKKSLWFESKSDKTEDFRNSQIVMNILGGGVSLILILIGILNFINIMITGVNIRLKEFAIMESIGMTKKQIKKMLILEGGYYGIIITGLTLTLGTGTMIMVANMTKSIADYAVFKLPIIELILMLVVIILICVITPVIVYKVSSKKSVTERIREIEN